MEKTGRNELKTLKKPSEKNKRETGNFELLGFGSKAFSSSDFMTTNARILIGCTAGWLRFRYCTTKLNQPAWMALLHSIQLIKL